MNQELYFEPRCGGLVKLKNHLIVQVAPMELTILLKLIFLQTGSSYAAPVCGDAHRYGTRTIARSAYDIVARIRTGTIYTS